MKNKESLASLGEKEMTERLAGERQALQRLRINNATAALQDVNLIKQGRRNIARLLTAQTAATLGNQQVSGDAQGTFTMQGVSSQSQKK